MKSFLFFILNLPFFCTDISGQMTIPALENTSNDSVFVNDSSIRFLRNNAEITILYRIVNNTILNGSAIADFKGISLQPDGNWLFYRLKQKGNKRILIPLEAHQDSIKIIYQTLADNDLFRLKTSDQIRGACSLPALIGGSNYEFRILTKNQYKKISYARGPAANKTNECPEIQRIRNCAKAVFLPNQVY